jgi:hypothetical protein
MPVIWFTPDSARLALPRVAPVAERIRALYRALEARHRSRVESDHRVDAGYFAILSRYAARVDELRRAGVRLGDPRRGAVEFPAQRAGRPGSLCWRVGEPARLVWREAGTAGAEPHPEPDDGSRDEDVPARG